MGSPSYSPKDCTARYTHRSDHGATTTKNRGAPRLGVSPRFTGEKRINLPDSHGLQTHTHTRIYGQVETHCVSTYNISKLYTMYIARRPKCLHNVNLVNHFSNHSHHALRKGTPMLRQFYLWRRIKCLHKNIGLHRQCTILITVSTSIL